MPPRARGAKCYCPAEDVDAHGVAQDGGGPRAPAAVSRSRKVRGADGRAEEKRYWTNTGSANAATRG